ncbi:MAG: SpoIVB peptidase S55 domain-containing protein [Brevinema sp.]
MRNLFFLICLTSSLFAQSEEFFPEDQLKTGMKGYALTVMEGLEPEKLELEVIAYMPNSLTKGAMILMKLTDEKTKLTFGAAGMSGSPIYIDGKLVGALAYGWGFSKEAIIGVAPIRDMISDKSRSQHVSFPNAKPIKTMWSLEGMTDPELLKDLETISSDKQYPGVEEFTIITSSRSHGIAPLKGGDAVAVKLVDGDISLSAIGTVTYVNGEDVYIFGHPFDKEGPINLPISRARIHHVLANSDNSFKMGSALSENIGATMFDGMSAVYGRFDRKAHMTPVQINVIGSSYSNSYNMNIARSKKYLPMLLGRVVGSVLERELGKNIEKQIDMYWNLQLTNNIVISNSTTWVKGTLFAPTSIKDYWINYINLLWDNPLVHLTPEKVEININVSEKPYNYYNLYSAHTTRKTFLANENVDIKLSVAPFLGDLFQTNISLQLPKNIKSGIYSILVGSALDLEMQIFQCFPHAFSIRTKEQLIKELRRSYDTKNIKAILVEVNPAAISGTHSLPKLPKSKQSLFKNKMPDSTQIIIPNIISNQIPLDEPFLGVSSLVIEVVTADPISLNK